jgi:hypothetical protein
MFRKLRNFLAIRPASTFDYLLIVVAIVVACASILNGLVHLGG